MYNLQSYNLHGQVKSIKESVYKVVIKNDRITPGLKTSCNLNFGDYYYYFNNLGNLTKEKSYHPDKKLANKYTYKYDESGKLIERTFGNNKEVLFRSEFLYNKDELLFGEKNYYKNFVFEIILFLFDKEGNYIGEELYDNDGNKISSGSYVFDKNGLHLEYIKEKVDGTITCNELYSYDINGNKIQMVFLVTDHCHKIVHRYDSSQNETDEIIYKSENEIEKHRRYEYSFDETGNWIRKILFENNIPVNIFKRIIEYY